jgi:hypothetical protein
MSSSSTGSSKSRTSRRSARALRAALRDAAFAGLTSLAWLLLIASRGVVRAVPLRRITSHLGAERYETPVDGIPRHRFRRVRRIRNAILIASPLTPTNSNCYPQALTAHVLLRLSRLPSTFYYGAALDEDSGLDTHVWVRCGRVLVTGAAPADRTYATLATYAYVPRRSDVVASAAPLEPPGLRD